MSSAKLRQSDFGDVGALAWWHHGDFLACCKHSGFPRDGWDVVKWQHPAQQSCEPLGSQGCASVCTSSRGPSIDHQVDVPHSQLSVVVLEPGAPQTHCEQTPNGFGLIWEPPPPSPPTDHNSAFEAALKTSCG